MKTAAFPAHVPLTPCARAAAKAPGAFFRKQEAASGVLRGRARNAHPARKDAAL